MVKAKMRRRAKSKKVKKKRDARYYYNPNDAYFGEHFEELVDKHGGKWIVIAGGKRIAIGPGHKLTEMFNKAKEQYPDDVPLVSQIPRKEDFSCTL